MAAFAPSSSSLTVIKGNSVDFPAEFNKGNQVFVFEFLGYMVWSLQTDNSAFERNAKEI